MRPMDSGRNARDAHVPEILERCRVRLADGDTIARCLRDYPDHADELAVLLPLVVEAQGLAAVPSPARAAASRRRFHAALEAARTTRKQSARRGGFLGVVRRIAAPLAAVLLVLGLSGFGVVQAANDPSILPDSPLYSVKQARENLGQALDPSPDGRATYEVHLVGLRLRELAYAEQTHRSPELIRRIVMSMVATSHRATMDVLTLPDARRAPLAAQLGPMLAAEQQALQRLAAGSPRREAVIGNFDRQLQSDAQSLAGH